MQLRYVFSELGQGLRRNLTMHVAVVLTLFVSLTLVGLGVLLNQQADKAAGYWGSQLQITVWLCKDRDDNPACTGEVTDAQKAAIQKVTDENPEVADYHFESKEEAFVKIKELLGPEKFEGPNPAATADDMPESLWITLNDPDKYQGITSAVVGLDGVSDIRDARETLKPIYGSINALQWGALGTAAFLVIAALLLVGNTIRLAAFARRREIGIMRLVGASTLYIALPFLLEALVTALIGVGLAAGGLGAFMYFGVHQRIEGQLNFIPWIGMAEYTRSVVAVGILGPILTLLPTLVLTRKYLKV
jgi:cell division transport system permease protein